MTAQQVLEKFKKDYPGKNIVCLPEDNPTEIICEIEPSSEHPGFNRAIAAIKSSAPHYHNRAKETYKVISGKLYLHVDGKSIEMGEGDEYVVPASSRHYAKGDFTIVQVDSIPGWTFEDHILIED